MCRIVVMEWLTELQLPFARMLQKNNLTNFWRMSPGGNFRKSLSKPTTRYYMGVSVSASITSVGAKSSYPRDPPMQLVTTKIRISPVQVFAGG